MTGAEDDHAPLSNHEGLTELALPEQDPGDQWDVGAYAAIGLETVEGWSPPARYLAESSAPTAPRGIDSLLPDAPRLSRRGYRPESTLGSDERKRIHETTKYPWRPICQLHIEGRNGDAFIGTGFFIGPCTIATAGHCLYLPEMGGWAEQITVSPARNGRDRPFSSIVATRFHCVRGWTAHGKRELDYGAITLDEPMDEVGSLGYGVFDPAGLTGSYLNLAGYPADKDEGTTLWWSARRSAGATEEVVTYDVDTAAGQSGAPVWRLDPDNPGRRVVVGIHTNGARTGNSATRINKAVFRNLQRWTRRGSR